MKYIIIEETQGIFLGNYLGISIFTKDLQFPIAKAYAFDSREKASFYVSTMLRDMNPDHNYNVKEIDYDGQYIPVDVLVKNGLSKYTETLLMQMPAINEQTYRERKI